MSQEELKESIENCSPKKLKNEIIQEYKNKKRNGKFYPILKEEELKTFLKEKPLAKLADEYYIHKYS